MRAPPHAFDGPATALALTEASRVLRSNTCSTECQALADAALGAGADVSADGIGVPTGAGACCPEGGSATHPANCTGTSVSHGDNGNTLDYAGTVAVYAASGSCIDWVCNTDTLAGAFCAQTGHQLLGLMICGPAGTLGFVNGLRSFLAGTAIPPAMLSCINTTGTDVNTASMTVTDLCASSSTPCPAAAGDGYSEGGLLSGAARTSAAVAAAAVAAALFL